MVKQTGIVARKKRPLDISRIRVDVKKLFSRLGEAATRAEYATPLGTNPSAHLVAAVIGSIDTISLETPASERAWHLIKVSLATSISNLLGEWLEEKRAFEGDIAALETKIELAVEANDIILTKSFFNNPGNLPIVEKVAAYLYEWCSRLGLDDAAANAMASRFSSYFSVALHDEWRLKREFYSTLFDSLGSPFSAQQQIAEDWQRYRSGLARAVDSSIFGDVFSLRQIYVPLRASYREHYKDKDDDSKVRTIAVDAMSDLKHWIASPDRRDAITIIKGLPGSGKSSLLRMMASELANEDVTESYSFRSKDLGFQINCCPRSGRICAQLVASLKTRSRKPHFAHHVARSF